MDDVLIWTIAALSLITVIQKKPLHAVLMRTAVSILCVGAYILMAAPDVALAEAMLGVLLTTFIYIMAIKISTIITVGYVPAKILFEEHGGGFRGVTYDIINSYGETHNYKIKYKKFDSLDELDKALGNEKVDLAAGPVTKGIGNILPTKIFTLNGKEYDYITLATMMSNGEITEKEFEYSKNGYYNIGTKHYKDELNTYIKGLKESGEYTKILKQNGVIP
jgi:putative multicomponent Na+:H+ antiporter subunit B